MLTATFLSGRRAYWDNDWKHLPIKQSPVNRGRCCLRQVQLCSVLIAFCHGSYLSVSLWLTSGSAGDLGRQSQVHWQGRIFDLNFERESNGLAYSASKLLPKCVGHNFGRVDGRGLKPGRVVVFGSYP